MPSNFDLRCLYWSQNNTSNVAEQINCSKIYKSKCCCEPSIEKLDSNTIIDLVESFVKNKTNINFLNMKNNVEAICQKYNSDTVMTILKISLEDNQSLFFWYIVQYLTTINNKKFKQLTLCILKYILTESNRKYFWTKSNFLSVPDSLFNIFIKNYDDVDTVNIFAQIFDTDEFFKQECAKNIFSDLIASDNIYSEQMLKILLQTYDKNNIEKCKIVDDFKYGQVSELKISKLKIFLDYCYRNKLIFSNNEIVGILHGYRYNNYREALDAILKLGFCPTDLNK